MLRRISLRRDISEVLSRSDSSSSVEGEVPGGFEDLALDATGTRGFHAAKIILADEGENFFTPTTERPASPNRNMRTLSDPDLDSGGTDSDPDLTVD